MRSLGLGDGYKRQVYFILVWAMARLAQWLDERQQKTPKAAVTGGIDELGLDDAVGAAP